MINIYAGGSKHQLQDIGRLLDRANQALQTLERYKVRLDDAIANLTALELEDVVTLRDVVAVVQRGEMVHRIADEIETMIVELGVDARLLRLQLDEIYGDVDDELDLVVADYLPAASHGRRTRRSRWPASTTTTCSTTASPPAPCIVRRRRDLDQEVAPEGSAAPAPRPQAPARAGRCGRQPLRRAGQAAAGDGRRPDAPSTASTRSMAVADQGHARTGHRDRRSSTSTADAASAA